MVDWRECLELDVWPNAPIGILYEVWLARRKQRAKWIPALFARAAARNSNSVSCPVASSQCPLPPLAGDGVPSVKICENQANNDDPSQYSLPPLAGDGFPNASTCEVQANDFQSSASDRVEAGVAEPLGSVINQVVQQE